MTKKTINPGLIMHDIEGPICFKPQNIYQKSTNQGCALHVRAYLDILLFDKIVNFPYLQFLLSAMIHNDHANDNKQRFFLDSFASARNFITQLTACPDWSSHLYIWNKFSSVYRNKIHPQSRPRFLAYA